MSTKPTLRNLVLTAALTIGLKEIDSIVYVDTYCDSKLDTIKIISGDSKRVFRNYDGLGKEVVESYQKDYPHFPQK